jgi:RNA polymerase sigma-70 factor (ECF subfamily)
MKIAKLKELNDIDIVNDYLLTKSDKSANLFVRKYQGFVFQVVLRYLKNVHDAEDVSQDILIKALNSLHTFKNNASITTWLYRISVNHSKNFLSKKKIRNIFTFMGDEQIYSDFAINYEDGQSQLENQEFKVKFYNCLDKLPEKQRETFALRYFDDLSYEEISNILGTSVGGLKANYFQAVKKLGVLLNEK